MRVDDLQAAATEETGLTDFGDDSFREGLERLVLSVNNEATLNELGEMVAAAASSPGCCGRGWRSRIGTAAIPRSTTSRSTRR